MYIFLLNVFILNSLQITDYKLPVVMKITILITFD